MADILIAAGAAVTARGKDGGTPLLVSARSDDAALVGSVLVCPGATEDYVNSQGENGNTSAHYAAANGSVSVLAMLIERGADIRAPDWQRVTPTMVCCIRGDVACTRLCLDTGRVDLEAIDAHCNTCLTYAIRHGHAALAAMLMEAGAEVQVGKGAAQGPLHTAVESGMTDTVVGLLTRGADVNAARADHRTPLLLAVTSGRQDILGLILHQPGVALDTPGPDNVPALAWACRTRQQTAALSLIAAGADPNRRSDRTTPLSSAA
ncbi:ankyrin repeat protein [Carpediemonas membranifera]|uniref:Ankyrin repeat protein n=1 Tax=Carpediemonas membranifera TaxID=201153 RepID=A0A8J6B0E5_9EUKA|nr:ankyrin repeat protein [Carpediemonas membranifera]|eukprot:KAG9392823.1 ankyrin repeat protein [Carpediemonas membranifera]